MGRQKGKKEHASLPLEKKAGWEISGFRMQAVLLLIVGLIFYANSFYNEYALDDGIVIQNNDYVQQGIRGIPKIMSTDAYDSFYRQMGAKQQLSGGRYRPLSVVTFAVEQQFFGSKEKVKPPDDAAFVRHFMNVMYYIFSVICLLYLLRNFIFKENQFVAFAASFIFLIHPLHTEVVANVKSRDEILSFLFIVLTFIAVFRYREKKSIRRLILALVFYFLALLSKEYAITLVVLMPMLFYIVKKDELPKAIISFVPFYAVALLYIIIRVKIVGTGAQEENPDVLNNPYMYATDTQKLATRFDILNRYLKLLFYPNVLSSDYSYSTIPFVGFSNSSVISSIILHTGMIVATVWLFFKRNILAFALAFYLLHLALISNFVFNVGATMGERMVYHSSFGFAIIVAIGIDYILRFISSEKVRTGVAVSLGILLVIWCGAKTITRNAEWKNDRVLFITDAAKVPQSALVNGNAGKAYVDMSELPENKAREKEMLLKGIYHLTRAVRVHSKYVNGYLNRGVAYFKMNDYVNARKDWDMVAKIYPNNPFLKRNYSLLAQIYFNKGMRIGGNNTPEAIRWMEMAAELDPGNAEYWYNIGGASFTIGDFAKARAAWTRTLQLKPDHAQARQGMAALPPQ